MLTRTPPGLDRVRSWTTRTRPGRHTAAHRGERTRVALIGAESASEVSRGGIASVIAVMEDGHADDVTIAHVVTYRDTERDDQARVFARATAELLGLLLRRRVDVAHVHVSYKGSVVRKAVMLRLARVFGVPTVLHAHSHGFKAWYDGLGPLLRRLVRLGLVADRWVVLGDGLASEYREMFGLRSEQVTVLRNPVVTRPSPRPSPSGSTVEVVFLGRLGVRKGAYDLVEAVAALPAATRARLHLTMAGDGEVDQVRAAAEAAGVADVLTFAGWIDPATRARLLEGAGAFVLPSYEEGLPMAMLEAMSFGVPIVVTPVGGIGEVVRHGENGLLVRPGDIEALTEALRVVVDERDRAERMGRSGWRTSQEFDAESWRRAVEEIWRETRA